MTMNAFTPTCQAIEYNPRGPDTAMVKSVASLKSPPKHLGGFKRYVDMFCGIEGFHYAAASYGMECVFACDIDEEARKAYEHNFGVQCQTKIFG